MGTNQEVLFARTLEAVKKQAKEQQNCISEQQVREAFAPLDLSEEQFALVFDYLKKHKIGIDEPVDLDEYLSEEEIDYLEEYKKELSMIEEVSEGKKEAIILSAMAGEKDAQDALISLFLPQVVEVSKLYSGQGVFIEDLIGEGNVALVSGMELLGALEDPTEAEGMLGRRMMDAMEAFIAAHALSGDIGKQAAERVNRVKDAAKELSDVLLRKVTVMELARESEIPEEEIREALRLSAGKIEEIEDMEGSGKS